MRPLLYILLLLCSASARAQKDFGEVAFKNSGPAVAQADFLHGLAQLHNFEYEDAVVPENSVRLQNQQVTGRLLNIVTWMNSGGRILEFLVGTAYAIIADHRRFFHIS